MRRSQPHFDLKQNGLPYMTSEKILYFLTLPSFVRILCTVCPQIWDISWPLPPLCGRHIGKLPEAARTPIQNKNWWSLIPGLQTKKWQQRRNGLWSIFGPNMYITTLFLEWKLLMPSRLRVIVTHSPSRRRRHSWYDLYLTKTNRPMHNWFCSWRPIYFWLLGLWFVNKPYRDDDWLYWFLHISALSPTDFPFAYLVVIQLGAATEYGYEVQSFLHSLDSWSFIGH